MPLCRNDFGAWGGRCALPAGRERAPFQAPAAAIPTASAA